MSDGRKLYPANVNRKRTVSPRIAWQVFFRDDFRCMFCGAQPGSQDLQADHMVPHSKGGSDNIENLVTACQKCNRGKSNFIFFPKLLCEGPDSLDHEWTVFRSWGAWQIKWHPEHGACLEYTPYGYWIPSYRVHEPNWEEHINKKGWGTPHDPADLHDAISHFRLMISPRNANGLKQ